MSYCAFIERVLTFCIICEFGKATEAWRKSARKTVNIASKLLRIHYQVWEVSTETGH